MSKNIELQEEFEALINELERLKSINEITSENTNNTKKTIDEIESFVQSVNIFKTSIFEDYKSKKKDFEALESSLNATLTSLNKNVEQQVKKFESIASTHTDASNKTLELVKQDLQEKIREFTIETKTLRKKLETDFLDFKKDTSKELENSSIKINDLLLKIQANSDKDFKSLNTLTNENQNEVLKLLKSLLIEVQSNKKSIKKLTFLILIITSISALVFVFMFFKFI